MDQTQPSVNKSFSIKDLPPKPKRQNLQGFGDPINLITNHYQIDLKKRFSEVYIYGINIFQSPKDEPDNKEELPKDNRGARKQIFKTIQPKLKELLGLHYQSGFQLWAFKNVEQSQRLIVTSLGDKQIYFQLMEPQKMSHTDLMKSGDLKLQIRQIINVIVKNYLEELKLVDIGKNQKYFNLGERDKNPVQGTPLKVMHGFKTATNMYDVNPLLLIDFSVRVLRSETALQRVQEYQKANLTKGDIDKEMQEYSVMTNYGNQQIYKIHKVDWDQTPLTTFKLKDGTSISYEQYYLKRYNLKVTNKTQPILIHNKKEYENQVKDGVQKRVQVVFQIGLIPELCNMTGIRDQEMGDRNMMKNLAQFTKLEPQDRLKVINKLKTPLTERFTRDGFNLLELKNFKGVLLRPPRIQLGGNKQANSKDGNFMIRDPIFQPAVIDNWLFVYNKRGNRDDDEADEFLDCLKGQAKQFGMKISDPKFLVLKTFDPKKWCDEIFYEVDDERKAKKEFQLIFTWMPEKEKAKLYPAIKELCYKELGIPHQNALTNKFLNNKNKGSIGAKIAFQLNAKLGKGVWQVEKMNLNNKRIMLVGVDVYHKLVKGRNSCAGFVASMDDTFSTYFSATVIQPAGQQLMSAVAQKVTLAVREYLKINKKLPEIIIIYRDGVGESQIRDLVEVEVTKIIDSFPTIDPKFKPEFVELMINKKINQRFFSDTNQGVLNAQSGTLVYEQVVHDDYFEFYLIPQKVTQGTATPTSYKLVANTSTLSQEQIIQMTYFQCFNYANWTGAVRVPAPVQYAHKLAYLIGDTFQGDLNEKLTRSLCYL